MKTKETTPGKTYSVHTSIGCTVSDQNGWSKTIDAPDGYFTAHAAEVTIEGDDDATVKELFKLAPVKLRALGLIGGGVLPSGYLAAGFLESTGATEKMTVACPPPPYTKWQLETVHAVNKVTIHQKTQQEGINNGMNSFQWATYSYLNSDSVWLQQFFLRGGGIDSNLSMGTPDVWGDFKRIVIYITPTMRGGSINGVPYEGAASSFTINIPTISLWGTSGGGAYTMPGKKKTWKLLVDGRPVYDMIAALDPAGIPCMYDRVTKQPIYNSSTGAFIAGFDTVEQARKLATLPDVTAETDETKKSLTVSLPWEAQLVVTGVPAALQVASNRGWTITVQYRDPEADNAYYNKYITCTSVADMTAVNADYKNDLTADGKWIYELPELKSADRMFSSFAKLKEFSPKALDSVTGMYLTFNYNRNLKNWNTLLPAVRVLDRTFSFSDLEVFDLDGAEIKVTSLAYAFYESKKFSIFNATLTGKIYNATNAFYNCILDKPSLLRIAKATPSKSGVVISLGIHIDYENDQEVLDAIVTMESNGWAVDEQFNGTPTAQAASTWGLRRRPIYANSIEIDGERHFCWGHYVTNWEARGYQEFTSVEEAKEYFNINQSEEV